MAADLTEPLDRLRDDLRAVRLELDVPGAEEARRVRDDLVAQVDDYLLPRLRQMDAPALIVVGGSTGRGQVDAREQPRRLGRQPGRRAPADDAGAGARRAIRTTCAGSRTTASCPGCRARPAAPAGARDAAARRRRRRCRRASRCSTRPTSTPSSPRTARSRTSCSRPRTAGSSSRPPRATPTPCRGSSCARRASGARRSPSCSTACRRTPAARCRRTCARCCATSGSATPRCSSSPRSRSQGELLPAEALAPVRGWLDGLAADAQARGALVRRTLRGALASLPVRALVRRARGDGAALRGRRAARGGGRRLRGRRCARSRARSAAARSCAARCSRAGTRWSGRAT